MGPELGAYDVAAGKGVAGVTIGSRMAEIAAQRVGPDLSKIYTGQVTGVEAGGGYYQVFVQELNAYIGGVPRVTSDTRGLTPGRYVSLVRIGTRLVIL